MKIFNNVWSGKSLSFLAILLLGLWLVFPMGYVSANSFGAGNTKSPGPNEASPVPDIKANGQDGPLTISTSDSLAVTVTLNAAGNTSSADWWAVVRKPDGNWYYFQPFLQGFQLGLTPTYQGALFDLSSYQVLTSSGLSLGTYTYYFGVDFTVDGSVTMGNVVYDSVVVNVSAGTSPTPTPTPTPTGSTVTDIDGNVYNTVTIGTQVWMKENLKVTKFRNGDSIPTTTGSIANDPSSIYQWAYNDDQSYVSTYGLLYTWYAATDSRGLCPSGWHVPTDTEWSTLETYLGGSSVAGGKMKQAGTTHWLSPNTGATNSSGFTALPGGYRFYDGAFYHVGNYGYWWASTSSSTAGAWDRSLHYSVASAYRNGGYKSYGFSVRCLRD